MRLAILALAVVIGTGYSVDVYYARHWLRARVVERQFRCAAVLFERESHWNVHSHNPVTGAHGIPQAVPGSRMAKAEEPRWGRRWDDWRDDAAVQVRWGRWYVRGRYGSFCSALRFQTIHGWY